MNKKRLLHLAKILRESPAPDRFTMTQYMHKCGTPACVLGHLAAADCSPLSMTKFGMLTWDGKHISYSSPEVCEYFGITFDDAYDLFSSRGCQQACTPEQAADYIEYFVKRHHD